MRRSRRYQLYLGPLSAIEKTHQDVFWCKVFLLLQTCSRAKQMIASVGRSHMRSHYDPQWSDCVSPTFSAACYFIRTSIQWPVSDMTRLGLHFIVSVCTVEEPVRQHLGNSVTVERHNKSEILK